ncbi:hypothetical protein B0T39_07725 [Chromobacterium haemolyticum]|nr:hypothetical protein B0T39_07725 [Chromobacterium haemolyticum]
MSPEAADAALPDEREPEVFELMAEGLPVWRVWQGMQTQWRAGPAGVLGLDYAALPVVERALGVELGAERFEWLLGMEFEALRCLSKKRG